MQVRVVCLRAAVTDCVFTAIQQLITMPKGICWPDLGKSVLGQFVAMQHVVIRKYFKVASIEIKYRIHASTCGNQSAHAFYTPRI